MLSGKTLSKLKSTCNHPECIEEATTHWALVDLCEKHREMIKEETDKYYSETRRLPYTERVEYLKIAHLIPWSIANLGEVLPSGEIRGD